MIRRGLVESIEANQARVLLQDAACESCATPCAACRKPKKQVACVENTLHAAVGDLVELECSDRVVLTVTLCLFFFPLLLGFCAAFLLQRVLPVSQAVLYASLCVVFCLFCGVFLLSRPRVRRKTAFHLARILPGADCQKELDKP